MKTTLFLLAIILLASHCQQKKASVLKAEENDGIIALYDTSEIDLQITLFKENFDRIAKELADSAARIHPNDVDFSDLTSGINRKYDGCQDEMTKILWGYELAENYFIHFDGSKNPKYPKMAEPLFYSFICYKDGVVASRYMKLDLKRIQFMAKEWNNFSEKDKETLMFYGLLRGFDNGLPDMLKNVE